MASVSENEISTTINDQTINTSVDQLVPLSQWMSQIANRVEISRINPPETLNYLNSILGQLKTDKTHTKLDNEVLEALSTIQQHQNEQTTPNHTANLKELIFKVNKKVFIESIDFYQKATDEASSIMKIQIELVNEGRAKWLTIFETSIPLPVQSEHQLFTPKLKASSERSDTVRLLISGDLTHLEGVEVKGSVFAGDLVEKKVKPKDPLEDYALLPRQLHQLVGSDLFSDVMFEVEGRRVAAHRNILVARSEYFRAMLAEERGFVEAKECEKGPVYIGDVTFEIFMQVMNFVYTGHVDERNFTHSVAG